MTGCACCPISGGQPPRDGRAINARLAGPGFGVAVSEVLPLGQTAQGHARVEAGKRGRLVIRVA